jgi:hypothetical protein
MIDPKDPVQYLEMIHRDMEWTASHQHGGRTWTAREGQLLREDGKIMAECPLNATAKLTASVLLAMNGSPHAVLRRVSAERALLADLLAEQHTRNIDDGWYSCGALTDPEVEGCCIDETRRGTCDCGTDARVERHVRLLAEGWGWTEEGT